MQDYKNFTLQVAESIKRCRDKASLTQDDVAEKLDIGLEAVSRIERGITIPTITRLAELADIFNCTLEDIIGNSSPRTQDQADYIAKLLTTLPTEDRQMVVEVVEKVCDRLKDRL
jgi:transcriptional regulator with XRE-family HTH domain